MALKLTRKQYENIYGTPPPAPKATTGPVKMTRAQFQEKFGQAPPTQQKEPVQEKSFLQKAGGFAKDVVRETLKPAITLAARPFQLAEELIKPGEQTPEELDINLPFFGKIASPRNKSDVIKDIGRGIETVALGLGGGSAIEAGAGGLAKKSLLQVAKKGAIETGKIGIVGGIGSELKRKGSEATAGGLLKSGAIGGATGFAIGGATPVIARGAQEAIGGVKKGVFGAKKLAKETFRKVKEAPITRGVIQKGKEFGEKVPRVASRAKEATQEAAIRAERIRTSTPEVQTAIKSGLDDRVINTVAQSDDLTKKSFKEMVDIAESSTGKRGGKLKPKQRPEIVAGRAAENQYKTIDLERKTIGGKIGAEVKKLSKTKKVSMKKSYDSIDGILEDQGIAVFKNEAGETVGISFSGTKFTPAERARIKEIYRLATESGENMTPAKIRNKDQLFSKLQRESRFEGIGDIRVETPDGSKSLFRAFRDIFSDELEKVSPKIRKLNKKYRELIMLQDDIENSIIKSGKFETSKGVSGSEFAQTNLRRLSSDALSAADYRAIVAKMDKVARSLGYKGSNPEELALFANELRKLYPETIPPTGFQGGIRTSVLDLAGKVIKAGEPGLQDQQRALRGLLEVGVKKTKVSNFGKTAIRKSNFGKKK